MQINSFNTLQNDLKYFGLNPKQWMIKPLDLNNFEIINKEDHQWIFHGIKKTNKKRTTWKILKLFSI